LAGWLDGRREFEKWEDVTYGMGEKSGRGRMIEYRERWCSYCTGGGGGAGAGGGGGTKGTERGGGQVRY